MKKQMKLNLKVTFTAILFVLSSISAYAQTTDTDGDGIIDSIDIDDDNDGVLDVNECDRTIPICFDGTFGTAQQIGITSWGCLTTTVSSPDIVLAGFGGASITSPGGGAFYTAVHEPGSWNESSMFTLNNLVSGSTYKIKFFQSSIGQDGSNWNEGGRWIFRNGTTTLASATILPAANATGGRVWTAEEVSFVATSSSMNITISALSSHATLGCRLAMDNFVIELVANAECDTDNDGIVNRLDLDSDGDGCSDALEAGATSDTTKNFKFTGAVGSNGLVNTRETALDNGIINYALSYDNAINSSIKACTDTDGDGIFDLVDIDDDNDGIPDNIECPSSNLVLNGNFESNYGSNDAVTNSAGTNWTNQDGSPDLWSTPMPTTGTGVWGGLADGMPPSPNGGNFAACGDWTQGGESFRQIISGLQIGKKYQISFYYANAGVEGSTTVGNAGSVALDVHLNLNSTLEEVFTTPFIPYLGEGSQQWFLYSNTFTATATSHILQFSADNGTTGEAFGVITNYKYVAVDGIEIRPVVSDVICDSDNDGIPNYLDSDSDNDGCSDALEAGATTDTTKNFKFSGPYGANGMVNSKESILDIGVVNYNLTYNNVISSTIKGCLDTDGDGILDIYDIDDDNDGILDTDESVLCAPATPCTIFPTSAIYGITSSGCLGWTSVNANFDYIQSFNNKPVFDIQGSTNPLYGSMLKTYRTVANNNYSFTVNVFQGEFAVNEGRIPTLRAINAVNGTVIASVFLNRSTSTTINFNAVSDSTRIEVGYTSVASTNIGSTFWYPSDLIMNSTCADLDSDGDGIPNRLDLDSDNDGCSDAFEAGATSVLTGNFKFSGPYGTNGLANSKETVADNGIINYSLKYSSAISPTVLSCYDFDNDNVFDDNDIDDDNDGILDHIESPNCYVSAADWYSIDKQFSVNITSDFNTNTNLGDFTALLNGNNTQGVVQFLTSPAQNQLNKTLFKLEFLNPVELNAFYVLKNSATQISGGNVMLQGSNNNVAWVDLWSTASNPANASNVAENATLTFANSNKYTVSINKAPYLYYRVVGAESASVLGGVATEFHFDVNASKYIASYFPKYTNCTEDADNDGFKNHQDLDSDNDGCSDAFEGGSTKNTTANYKFLGGFGTNGLDNSVETATDNGIINYTLTYSRATNASVRSCATPNIMPNIGIDSTGTLNLCQLAGGSRQLTASLNPSNNGGTLNWYTAASGGTASTTAPTISLTNTTTVSHWVSQTVNGIESPRTEIKVVVNPIPSTPGTISGPTLVSSNSTNTHSIAPVANATGYVWTLPSTFSGSSNTTSITSNSGTQGSGIISVQASINGCLSAASTLNITVSDKPSKPSISSDTVTFCQNSNATQLTASLNPSNNGGTLKWYASATGGTALAAAPTPSTNFASISTFYVTQTVNGSESDRAPIVVVVKPVPNQPNSITGPASVAANTSYTYSIVSVSGATSYTWTLPSGWSGSSTTTSINVTTNTTTSGTVSVVANVNGCSSSAQTLTVGTLPSKPDVSGNSNLAGDSIVYCQNVSATQLTAALNPSNNGGTLKWYTTAVGGTALASAPTPSTTSAGTTLYYVSQTVNGIESDRALVRVIVKPVPNQPNTISGPSSVAANTSYTYSIGSVSGATSYTWTLPSGWSGSSTTTSISVTTNTTTSGNISVVANLNGCSSSAQTLTVGTLPSKPDVSGNSNLAGDSIVYCQNATATQLTATTNPSNNGGTLKWYTTAVGGTALASAPTPSTTSAGTTMYYVSQTVSGVESDRALIRVIVKPAPNQPNTISGTAAVSTNTAYTYSVGAVTGATSYTWTLPSGWNGTSTTNTININTNNTTTGDITVTANLNGCSSLPQTFSVGSLPAKPNVSGNPNINGDSIVYCQNASANQLTATTNPTNNGGTLKWYTTSTGGSALAAAPTPSTVSAGTTIYYVSQTVNSVESERAAVKIIVRPVPNQPNSISGPSSVSANTSYTYSIGSVTGATSYTWTIPNGWNGSSTTTSISVTTNTTTSGTVSVVANLNGCSSSVQTLTVGTLPSKPDVSNNTNLVGDSITYCQGASANQLTATTNPSNNGGTLKWYTTSVGGTGSTTAPTPSTANVGNTSYYVSQTVNGVESERAEIRVLVKSTPNQPNAISGNTSVTANTSYTYSVGAVSGATSYTWTIPSGWSGSSTTNSININTNSVTTGTISVTANTGNCSSAAQTLSLGAMPLDPDISGNTNINGDSIVYCQNAQTVQLTAKTNPANNGGTLKWYTTPSGGTASTTAPTPTATSAGTTIYYVTQTVNGVESNRAQIRVIVKPIPNQPNAITGNTSVTANSSFTYSVGAVTGATSYTWTIPNAWSGSSTTNTISVTTNTTTSGSISVTANLNGCSSAAQSITIGTLPNNPTSGLAGDSIVYCQNATATQLTATTNPSNNGGTLKWYTIAVGGTGSTTAPTPITTLLGTTTYYVSQIVNNVESNRTAIKVVVTNQNCAAPCYTSKPVLGSNQVYNNCPTTTADLTSVSASNQPVGAVVTWHTALPATSSNKVSNPTAVAAGVYYAIFYNPSINCYADSGKAGTSILVTITNCSKCNAGTNAPMLNTFGISNVCPATAVDLTSLKATNQPAGTVLEWFSGLPISVNNKVSNPTAVNKSGTYYAIFFDATNNCYANNGLSTTPVVVTISTCPTPCNAGGNAPAINVDAVSNICPATTVNLNNITATNVPSGASLQWHTGLPASASNKVSNPSSVLGGLYYAVFFDATNNCYSANGFGVKPIQVVITNCPDPCNAGTTAPVLSVDSAINNCPQTTVDLASITANNIPNGTSLQWHTALPATAGNRVANPAAVSTGTYYAIFYDATNKCFTGQGYIAKRVIASTSNCGPACNAGNFTPNVSKNVIVNTCPTTTVNLNTITASNQPKNTTLSWHTSIPASASNKIANPQAYGSQGTVYAVFYDSKNDCYNQGGNSGAEVTVVITSCPNPCKGGSENPKLSTNDITNICPATTSNLSAITVSNLPNGAALQWHTALPASTSNKLSNTTSVNSGTYYAVFYDATNNCYSMNGLSGTQILVANTSCPKCLVPANAPEIPNATIATECPATTANLNNVSVINKPRGVVVRWYTATSVSNTTLVSNPASVIEGTYYAAFYDTANNCFANNGNGNFTQVIVTLTKCCNAGNEAPKFNISTLTNICPATTVDLTAIKATNQPNYLVLEWHKSTPVSATSKVANYASVPAGTYYAVFFDPINKCYSANGTMTTPFTVSTIACNQCNAGISSPIVSTKTLSNSCPAKTADLSKITVSNQPSGTVLEWHTTTPVSKTTKVEDYTKVGAGTYYAIYYDPTNACYAGVGTATTSVSVSIVDCNSPCNAGNVAPMLSADYVTNNCPATTASLSTITAINLPSNAVLQWHTATPATAANKVTDPSLVSAGTYYAVFYDAANNCYSVNANGTTPVTVVISNCTNPTKCDTFKSLPSLAKDTTVNACPLSTANLTILANSTSNGIITTWHSATPASDANRIINPSTVGAGTYYAVLYDSINKCYATKGYATKKVTVTINNCPVCNAGNEAPIVDKINLSNICPTTSADLTTIKVSNIPRNTIVTWHTATPASANNRVSNPSAVNTAGTYYATFYDAANNCYANNGKATMSVQVDILTCTNTCASGSNAPTLGSTAIKNICPVATADLTTISASNKPASANVVLSWHTAIPATDFNKVSNPSSVEAGTYYAIFYDVVNKCYAANGRATTIVTASVENCTIKCNAGTFQPFFGTDSLLNKCPLTTANLSLMVAQNQPKGTIIEWRNASGDVVSNPSAVSAGTYTAYFKDTVNNCYSTGTPNPIQVKIVSCLVNGPKNDYAQFDSRSKTPKEIQTATNDTKTSGSKYSITPSGSPKRGTASIDPVTGKLTYTITDTSFVGYDTVTYQLCDTITNQCSTAYVIIALSQPKDTTVSNPSNSNGIVNIDLDGNKGIPVKPNSVTESYDIVSNPNKGNAIINPITGKMTYTKNPDSCGLDSVQVSKTYKFTDGRPDEVYKFWVFIDNECPEDGDLPNYFSPNGDGKNESFVLPAAFKKKYPNLRLSVFNRWGNMVWRSNGIYRNDWGGSHFDGELLPDGVYYYIIELEDQNNKTKTGFIQLMRH